MAQPTLSDVHVNALLTNLSLMYAQEESAFVARRVFPIVPVTKMSDRYLTYSRADFNRNTMRKRAPGTESAGGGYKIDNTQTYSVDVWSLHKDIDDQVRANADAILNLDMEATKWLVTQALISREVDWASNFFAAAAWNNSLTGVASAPVAGTSFIQWSDYAGSTPIQDVRAAKRQVQLAGLQRPNKMVLGRPVFDTLCDHPDFIDRIKYGQTPGKPAQATLEAMAQLFELDEVLVMDAIINSGGESAGPDSSATGTLNGGESNSFIGGASNLGGKAALLVYTPSAPGIMTPGCGYTFSWTGYFGATVAGERIKSFYIPQIESTRVEMDAAYAHKVVSKDLGLYFATAIA